MSNRFEDLEIYRLSESFSDEIWFNVLLCYYFAKDPLEKQLLRSADSIRANIAEGFCRYHFKENKYFCYSVEDRLLKLKAG